MLVFVQGWGIRILSQTNEKWSMDQRIDPEFIRNLEKYIHSHLYWIKNPMHYNRTGKLRTNITVKNNRFTPHPQAVMEI